MKILVTGSAGFIGSHLCIKLLKRGDNVIGIDNHNNYYDPKLKNARLKRFLNNKKYKHYKIDLKNKQKLDKIFKKEKIDKVVNLAAQAGVRYSLENPNAYIESNIYGFMNILESCRNHKIKQLVYASTSSVYGANTKMPFSENHNANHPLTIYAATKKSNELMAHTYSQLFNLPTTGLRFFTVYGPWGRPDMALFKFTKSILKGRHIDVYNFGKHKRDFTYIDDIIFGVIKAIDDTSRSNLKWDSKNPDPATSAAPWKIYNIGNSKCVDLGKYIKAIEKTLKIKAKINYLPLQLGDVPDTYADISKIKNELGYKPKTSVEEGIKHFVKWYKKYFKI
ncbi:NAD-dependent epimerase [Candidatus Pelagibacter sp.]|nr:NAD-dependent epimerase [Candidatus Pelagibacter sp.]